MKHRRSIDLRAEFTPMPPHPREDWHDYSFWDLEKGMRIGARCGKCGHLAWLDKHAMMHLFRNRDTKNVDCRLVCACGNRVGNSLIGDSVPMCAGVTQI